MADSKSFASLSSGLLARKGQAKPAMRPQAIQLGQTHAEQLEDLGWNDMGHEPAPAAELVALPGIEPVPHDAPVEVHVQQEALAREFIQPHDQPVALSAAQPAAQPALLSPMRAPRAAAGSKAKAAFTLRLDADRHLQLRLVCAVKHRSAQQIVTEALDQFLARQPEVVDSAFRTRR
jgi:hypothetical protein